MLRASAKAALLTAALIAATGAAAQTRHHRATHVPKETERSPPLPPPPAVDKRDSVVPAVGSFTGRPYWLALAQCGGIYFKLNQFYTEIAVKARSVQPNAKLNTEYTRKLNEAIRTATTFFNSADRFLMTDRGIERVDAVLIYQDQSRAAGERVKTIDAALAAARSCPVLYAACQQAHPKTCSETLAPLS